MPVGRIAHAVPLQAVSHVFRSLASEGVGHAPAAGGSAAPEASERSTESHGLTISHILVPLDGSPLAECAVPFAALLARALGAKITLLRVLEGARGVAPGRRIDAVEWGIGRAGGGGRAHVW